MGHRGKIGIAVLMVLTAIVLFLFWPLNVPPTPASTPAEGYAQAMERIATADPPEATALYPGCETQVITHGGSTEKVAVLLHGYKACPLQFAALGRELYEKGYNVYIPRMPRMGLEDHFAPEQADLSAEEVVAYTQDALDVAQGLGDEVIVVGLSAGGALASWSAQFRDDVEKVVSISPMIVPGAVPDGAVKQAVRIFSVLPNRFLWMDPELKEDFPIPDYVYPRNATRAVSNILRVLEGLQRAAKMEAPVVPKIVMVTNASDRAVSRTAIEQLVREWQSNGAISIVSYEFPADLELDHDLISPDHPKEQVAKVYPVLLDLITQ
jgi:esterase/lipase